MSFTPTTNYGFLVPAVNTEIDAWGDDVGNNFVLIDARIKDRQNEIAATLAKSGGTMTGKLNTLAVSASGAGINIAPGTVPPASPVNGDFWSTNVALWGRINGITYQFATTQDLVAKASLEGAIFTGAVSGLTATAGDNTTKFATTAFVTTAAALKASLAGATFTGAVLGLTATPGDNTTKFATTAFVTDAIDTAIDAAGAESSDYVAKTASYTLALGDAGDVIAMNVGSANTWTIPPNASVAFPLNTEIHGTQYGAGQTTITPGSGVTLRARGGLKSAGQYAGWTAKKIATNEWIVWGDLTA